MAEQKFEENLIEELSGEVEETLPEEADFVEEGLGVEAVEGLEAETVDELANEVVESLDVEPVQELADEAVENLEEETVEDSADEVIENLEDESVEELGDEVVENLEEENVDELADEAVENLEAEPVEEPADKTVEEPAEIPSSKPGMGKNIFFTIFRIVLVAALVCAIVYYVFLRNTASDTPASQVFAAVTESVKTDKMEKSTNRFFKKYYGLNAADFDDVLFYAPISNMDAEELLVVKLKDPSQAEAVSDAILKRQADKEQSFEGYAPEQYALTQKYILDVQGNYILFVIDENAETIDTEFVNSL